METLVIVFAIGIISIGIYFIKNLEHVKQKAKENVMFQGFLLGFYLIIIILIISFSIVNIIYALNNFGIINTIEDIQDAD